MNEIKLEKRYPHSREEDITDAFMRGYEKGKADRPQGEWIDDGFAHRCSECGKQGVGIEYYNYCPNCGAQMKGVDDE